ARAAAAAGSPEATHERQLAELRDVVAAQCGRRRVVVACDLGADARLPATGLAATARRVGAGGGLADGRSGLRAGLACPAGPACEIGRASCRERVERGAGGVAVKEETAVVS